MGLFRSNVPIGELRSASDRPCAYPGDMAYWWVNHKLTGRHEVAGDYLWSPKTNQNGHRNKFYDNMTFAKPGDIVFSFIGSRIVATGTVTDVASTAPKPAEFSGKGEYWSNEGWFLPVAFKAHPPLSPREHLKLIVPLLPATHSPIRADGRGNVVYLASISDELGTLLTALTGADPLPLPFMQQGPAPAWDALQDIDAIRSDQVVPETQKLQLIKARVGQGLFRSNTLLRNPSCRVTGVHDKRLLRASHIKPWRDSNNFERLDGANGIMLSPHVDVLFDLGLMSFADSGRALIRKDLSQEVLSLWSIPKSHDPSPFDPDQRAYLSVHRARLEAKGFVEY